MAFEYRDIEICRLDILPLVLARRWGILILALPALAAFGNLSGPLRLSDAQNRPVVRVKATSTQEFTVSPPYHQPLYLTTTSLDRPENTSTRLCMTWPID
ncbi:predicted protein [Histoplasma capsulatum H143]|uniref:Uncharacterized protein n=1 Tax=Ajellomyces capsulatus (strain H143) TaxID=544712 RepID=C6HHU7_AJECH|nr:predicted protein [Histoplasma capsulatum H143]